MSLYWFHISSKRNKNSRPTTEAFGNQLDICYDGHNIPALYLIVAREGSGIRGFSSYTLLLLILLGGFLIIATIRDI